MNILVTGGAGYIGSILVPPLLKEGHEVTIVDNFLYSQSSLLDCCNDPNLTVMRGDARDQNLMEKEIRGKDVIIPLAALVGAPLCDKFPDEAKSTNLNAVKLILELRQTEQKVILPNTNSGYGVGQEGIHCTEESPLNPISLYGRLKVDAEKAVLASGNSVTFRLATVAFLHAIKNFDTMKGHAYNVGLSNANLSKRELCEEIKKQIPSFYFTEAKIGEDKDKRNYIVSNEKIEKTGFKPAVSLQDGITELIKGYKIVKRNQFANI